MIKEADLKGAHLQGADLRGAYLKGADLLEANLLGADLQGADLQGANLRGANLRGAYLRGANLRGADLRGAYLKGAYLLLANLRGADLQGADLPHFQIVPAEGAFVGWKITTKGVVKLLILEEAKRTSSIVGRKCRASKVKVLGGPGIGGTGMQYKGITYTMGATIESEYSNDIRVECAEGIHFFMTEKEAIEWN